EAGVANLRGGSPALGRALLEQPEGVAVAVVEVLELGLLDGGGDRDDHAALADTGRGALGDDRAGVLDLGAVVGPESGHLSPGVDARGRLDRARGVDRGVHGVAQLAADVRRLRAVVVLD